MIRVGNDKLLIDDKELKRLVKEGYDRGVIFGCSLIDSNDIAFEIYIIPC